MIMAIKLLTTPLFICLVTLAGRKWGPTVSGLLIGLPLTSGPISLFLALQYGQAFAARAALGNMAGQVSVCLFCLVYFLASQRANWLTSSAAALAAFLIATLILDRLGLGLLPAFVLLGLVILVFLRLMPKRTSAATVSIPPRWDLPARMLIATGFVLALTAAAKGLGPQLSGLLSPLPIFALVIASFTLKQQGREAAGILLRGIVRSSWAYGIFFLIVGLFLTGMAPHWTYPLAAAGAIGASALVFLTSSPRRSAR